jgi:hypothetical protein
MKRRMFELAPGDSAHSLALSFLISQGVLAASVELSVLDAALLRYWGGYVLLGRPRQSHAYFSRVYFYVDASSFHGRCAPIWNHLVAASAEDPDFAERLASLIAARRAGMRAGLELLARRGALSVPLEQMADSFFLLANPELLLLSQSALDWTPERYKAWTWQQACRLLVDSKPRPEVLKDLSFREAALG